LGELIQRRGLWQRKCLHFDFGANLRRIVDRDRPDRIVGRQNIDFLRGVLASGALLEDEHFPIAERVLRSFLAEHRADRQTHLVLNGLPRHAGQARAVDAIVDVHTVLRLHCTGETVMARIRHDPGGDRRGRPDDELPDVKRKLAIYEDRTLPLAEHYRQLGVSIETLEVTVGMTPENAWQAVESAKCHVRNATCEW